MLRRQIVDDLAAVLAEILREVGIGQANPSGTQSGRLYSSVDAASGGEQSGESAPAIRAPAEMYGGGYASRFRPAKARRNIPSGESDESLIDEIRVLDPRHPLYGRSFRVIRRSTHRGGNFPPSYEVEYCSGSSLLIPIAVTEWLGSTNDQLKLSIDGLLDLISVIDCLDSHEYEPKRSLDYSAARPAASDRRRRRRSLGGGLP